VRTCDAFGLPLVVLVDTPGFMPGRQQETRGVLRHGADLLRAFANARVPRVTVILRKAYGGAFIAMNSRGLGADLTCAWPDAEIGIMSPGAAAIALRGRTTAAGEQRMAAAAAAREGFIDEVVAPNDTPSRLRRFLDDCAPAPRRTRAAGRRAAATRRRPPMSLAPSASEVPR
jgi:acetyl-CoA carboxylase carboxyltransferase component